MTLLRTSLFLKHGRRSCYRSASDVSSSSRPLTAAPPSASSTAVASRSFSSAAATADSSTLSSFQQKGWLDDRDLVQFDTLHEMQVRSCQVYESRNLFSTYSEASKEFEWMTFGEFARKVDQCRAVLHNLNISSGKKVALISNNRWEWATVTAAAYSLNAVAVPMYEAQLPSDWTYILNDSEASVVFCANDKILSTVKREVLPNTPNVTASLSLDAVKGQPHAFATLMDTVESDTAGKLIVPPTSDDLANLIYTSGTTGKPKGVELTHDNFASNVKAAARTMVKNPMDFVRQDDCSLAFLPWAHSYGQTCELWMSLSHGASMGVSRGIPTILDDLQLVKPTVLFSVPTLYKKIFDGVHNLMESASPVRKQLMQTALAMGKANADSKMGKRGSLSFVEKMKFSILDTIVLEKIRARFGGRLRHGFVAGAACPSKVLDFMDSIGIPIYEGYGLTETSPIISINSPEQRCVGSVGRPIGGVTVYIIDQETGKEVEGDGKEGEICCAGPNVMRGYYKNDAATKEVISIAPDGKSRMFHTGDLGQRTPDGYVKVTGRLKEQYKLENGKYIVPTPIEESIGMSRFIQQVVLTGDNRPYNVALIVPEWTAVRTELKLKESMAEEDLVKDSKVQKLLDDEIVKTTVHLKKFEIPQQYAIVAPFTAANNMLTPKMSIRRHKVVLHYKDVVDGMYPAESNNDSHEDNEPPQQAAA